MIETCPTDVVNAPAEKIWQLVTRDDQLQRWIPMKVKTPLARPIAEGDVVTFVAGPFGILEMKWIVGRVIEPRELHLRIEFPFGIVNEEVIQLAPTKSGACRVTFN
jgi:ligand-binding SRPBCC domain-containing protein